MFRYTYTGRKRNGVRSGLGFEEVLLVVLLVLDELRITAADAKPESGASLVGAEVVQDVATEPWADEDVVVNEGSENEHGESGELENSS